MKLVGLGAGVLLLGGVAMLVAQPPDRVRLAEFTTSLKGRTRNQAHNAVLAMSKLERVSIPAGGRFSFNETVGTYTVDAGFRKAPVSYNGTLLDGWGGGVCQTSTTVYNAALLAGLTVEKRSRHRFAPLYAPPGRDAAVAYPHIDLVISNPFPYPVELRCRWTQSALYAAFYAPRSDGDQPEVITRLIDVVHPRPVALTSVSSHGKVRNSGKDGFEVMTYRRIGARTELISHDSYPAMPRVTEYR